MGGAIFAIARRAWKLTALAFQFRKDPVVSSLMKTSQLILEKCVEIQWLNPHFTGAHRLLSRQ
jgi:hypothetical protein